jgi:hypothetical protein
MSRLACLAAFSLALCAAPAAALVEERVAEPAQSVAALPAVLAALEEAVPVALEAPSLTFGPFTVLDRGRAALVGTTDAASPDAFRAMLQAHPEITSLVFLECPGTYNDRANLELGRLIRAAGLAAVVPAGGSVRSGAVELVLAGTRLEIEDGAEFAVHAWEDQEGYEAHDYAPDSIEHRKYLAYYREMGMSETMAAAFYAMTNSSGFDDPLWLDGAAMRDWVGVVPASAPALSPALQAAGPIAAPRLAYLDLGLTLY